MKKTLWDLIKLLLPMNAEKRRAFEEASAYLSQSDLKLLRHYLKIDRTFPVQQKFHTSLALFEDREWPFFKSHLQDQSLHTFLTSVNAQITEKAKHAAFLAFAPNALERISGVIAPNIVGMDELKMAVALQLFAKEPVHVLLIGDPGTGKTDLLRSIHAIAPISSFGLGSGTSGAGLSAMAKGDEIIKGLLPLADNGIACIDELNLMKAKDMASLYNAMEKGFITYDKGSKHEQLPARVRVAATANPAGDTFIGKSAEILRKQIPFDDALLSRFHLIFIVRKPTAEEFERIASNIIRNEKHHLSKEDASFIKEYAEHASGLEIQFDPHHETDIVAFIRQLKSDERQFIVEVGPRTVVGIMRIVKAVARAELAQSVDKDHLERAFRLVRKSLYVRIPEEKPMKGEPKADPKSESKTAPKEENS